MSDISDARFRDAEYFSDDLTSQDNECSTSKCGSPGFRRKDEPKDEEVCLTAFSYSETSWTDLKHSIYLDCVEASFVQNMFARCYCAEDLCGAACRPCFHDHGHDQAHGFSDRKNCCSTEASLRPQASFENAANTNTNNWNLIPLSSSKGTDTSTTALLKRSCLRFVRTEKCLSDRLSTTKDRANRRPGMLSPGVQSQSNLLPQLTDYNRVVYLSSAGIKKRRRAILSFPYAYESNTLMSSHAHVIVGKP
ncbi:hypothetical protein KP509_24G075200 [Ceratopteris richardii]|uniref:Uncharacterized protein n=1 Tax=Ceratopteris richardii TaxID=49495 RepID=A0A8T2RWF2_CERRI|nr:hypothetical protein KP509_24G075200 [Ceratopteris richardii]